MKRALQITLIATLLAAIGTVARAEPTAEIRPDAETQAPKGRLLRGLQRIGDGIGRIKRSVTHHIHRAIRGARGRLWALTPLVRTAERWARQRSNEAPADTRLELDPSLHGMHVKPRSWRASLDGVEQRIARLRDSGNQRDYAKAHAERAVLLKQLWDARELHAERGWRGGRAESIVEALDRELAQGAVYATSRPDGRRDKRMLRTHDELRQDARFLAERIRDTPMLLPREIDADGVTSQLDKVLAQVDGKALYTRDGMEGVLDLISDPHLGERYVRGAESDARQQKLAERLHTTATVAAAVDALELDRVDVSADEKKLPLEVQYLLATEPSIRSDLDALDDHGLYLQKVRSTPRAVLDAIARVTVISQENFQRNWLPQLIRENRQPKLQPTERGIERAIGMGLIDDRNVTAEDLAKDIELIRESVGHYVKFVAPHATPELQAKLDRLNGHIDWIRREYTVDRMMFDNANHRTNEAQEVIKKMAIVGPVAHLLELAGEGVLAKVFAGSADDMLGEWAEIKALLGSGFSKGEIFKRLKVLVPVFGVATLGALEVEHLLASGHNLAAGATFGLSAVALSMTTAAQSMMMYRRSYDRLLEEGKVPGKVGQLASDPAFQKQLEAFERDSRELSKPQHRRALLALAERTLRQRANEDTFMPGEVEMLVERLKGLEGREILAQLRAPSQIERWKQAVQQDFSNPARLGLMAGAVLAPIAGLGAGALGMLHNGFLMAGLGSIESLVAAGTVLGARQLADKRYEHHIRRAINERRAKSPEAPSPAWGQMVPASTAP